MDNKKFRMLNTTKKEVVTHAELQMTEVIKRGGRPKKEDKDKLNFIVSLNVHQDEKDNLESEAESIGLNVASLVRVSLVKMLKKDFSILFMDLRKIQSNKSHGKVVKQYAVPVTQLIKEELESKAIEYMISVSDILKIALRSNGHHNI